MKKLCIALLFMITALAHGQSVSLGTYNCNSYSPSEMFDPTLNIEYGNYHFEGAGSCKLDARTYTMNLTSPVPLAQVTITISFWQADTSGNNITIRGRLNNNSTVVFSRSSTNGFTLGPEGRKWHFITYTYTGPAASTEQLTRIEWTASTIVRIDAVSGVLSDPQANARYLRMKQGYQDILINFNLDDVLNETQIPRTFRMVGRLNSNDIATVYAFDSAPVNPDVYVECASVSIASVIANPADSMLNFSVECVPPTLTNGNRGLFRVKNNGPKPNYPVEFVIQFNSIPRIMEHTRSAAFHYPMSLKTVITP